MAKAHLPFLLFQLLLLWIRMRKNKGFNVYEWVRAEQMEVSEELASQDRRNGRFSWVVWELMVRSSLPVWISRFSQKTGSMLEKGLSSLNLCYSHNRRAASKSDFQENWEQVVRLHSYYSLEKDVGKALQPVREGKGLMGNHQDVWLGSLLPHPSSVGQASLLFPFGLEGSRPHQILRIWLL